MQLPLHLPLDFELREDVRRLAQRLRAADAESAGSKAFAAIYFTRLWCDWGRAGVEWRSLEVPYAGEAHDWQRETLANIIEELCEWAGQRGDLIKHLIAAGMLMIQNRGDLSGFVLCDFWRWNEHLDPDYRSIQSRGGFARKRKLEMGAIDEMAGQQQKILKGHAQLTFEEALKVTPDEERRIISLIMRIDRACGLPVRASSEYTPALLDRALYVARTYDNGQITQVEAYLHRNQSNPEVVKLPDRVIAEFESYYRKVQ